MGQSADELRHDIEATRGQLGETLDAIGDRVSPGRMIERRKNPSGRRAARHPRPGDGFSLRGPIDRDGGHSRGG